MTFFIKLVSENGNIDFKRSRAWAHVQRSGWPGRYSYWESYSFQGYREILNFTLNWVETNTCLYEWMLGKGFLLYSVWNYKLVKEVVYGWGLMQECLLLTVQAILYYTGCTNGCICSSSISVDLASILSSSPHLGLILPIILMMISVQYFLSPA